MLTHTNIKSHECKFCKKKFSLKSNLTRQVKIHTEVDLMDVMFVLQGSATVLLGTDIFVPINNKTGLVSIIYENKHSDMSKEPSCNYIILKT